MMGPSYVTEFYELPLDRLAEFHRAAVPHWRSLGSNRRRWSAMLASLRQPIPPYEEPEPYLASVLAYLDEHELLVTQPPEHEQLLTDLVEFHGGGWDLLAAQPGAWMTLDPTRFNEAELQRFFEHGDQAVHGSGLEMRRAMHVVRTALDQTSDNSLLLVRYR